MRFPDQDVHLIPAELNRYQELQWIDNTTAAPANKMKYNYIAFAIVIVSPRP